MTTSLSNRSSPTFSRPATLPSFDHRPHESLSHRLAMHWLLPAEVASRTAGEARAAARAWVVGHVLAGDWPGLRAAHLVGGVTAMPLNAQFPPEKDVDLHLIFTEGSPLLDVEQAGQHILEESFAGYAMEAGLKPRHDYRSAEAVLANPEIAYHLTVDSVLYDPEGILGALQPAVRREYAKRPWVLARIDHEHAGLARVFTMLPRAREDWGASGEVNLFGYTVTFVTAALQMAALQPPSIGGRVFLHLRRALAAQERFDLYSAYLDALGLTRISRVEAARFLQEASAAFDRVVALRQERSDLARDFGPFAHKLHAHLKPYFVETCRDMLEDGDVPEAMGWIVPYHLSTVDLLLSHGPEDERRTLEAQQRTLLRALGLETDAERDAASKRLRRLGRHIFALADDMVITNPVIVD